jgi:hypothetical protein
MRLKIFNIKCQVNIFKKVIEENVPNLKKEMTMNILEAYRTPNRGHRDRIIINKIKNKK